jgi:hypothetical protein
MMINNLLDSDIPSKRIFFWACDLIESPQDLVTLIESYLSYARKFDQDRLFIFLDEISSVKEWQRGIKYIVDAGSLKNCTLILTGSHTLDIKYSAERLPGRRGNVADVLDKVFLPMKFSEYVDVRSVNISQAIRLLNLLKKARREEVLLQLSQGKIPEELLKLNSFSKELSRIFGEYLITGGIPAALDAFLADGEIPSNIYETYISSMIGDWARWNKKQTHMTQIVQRLIECLASQVSWNSICKQTDLNSHTAQEHIDILQSSFVVSPIYRVDRNKGTACFEKDKKIHFDDPFIFHALRGWAFSMPYYVSSREFQGNPEDCSKLVESVICNHLIRMTFNMFPSSTYDYINRVFYWESKLGKEVDFVVKLQEKYLPIEVKYQSAVKKDDLSALHSFIEGGSCDGGIVITKDILKAEEGIAFVPYYLFLCLI